MKDYIQRYLNAIQTIYKTGDAREHSYRPAFKELIESLAKDITVINEPSYTGGNAPDFLFKKGENPVAYGECKDVTVDVSEKEVQMQANRYVEAFGKILLTNYIDFEILNEKEGSVAKISIAKLESGSLIANESNFNEFADLIKDYLTPYPRTIRSAKKLAEIMASKARLLRDASKVALKDNNSSDVYEQYRAFKEVLISDLSEEEFADMYAQTLVYGLFVARYFDDTLSDFSRHEAHDLLPSTNPLLKKFFGHIAGTDFDPKIAWIVDDLIEAYKSADVKGIMHKEFEGKQKDPVLHFYETFLAKYDQGLRKSRGVYYTPEPVVSFIVRSVDQILKDKFGLTKGLTDTSTIEYEFKINAEDGRTKDGLKKVKENIHRVQVLDPAVGTGTFLNEVIREIHKTFKGQEGVWPAYAKENLLPRLHGFELMMASYTMAHLKLGVTLKELGYSGDDRLSVWLTNSLENNKYKIPDLWMSRWLIDESNRASKIKSEMPIMVVLGNPPYSGESFNKNYSGHNVYKVEPGGRQKLQERNSKWINDDYVKFIRFAENQVDKTGEGVVGFITPHGYLDNPTFRGMRWHLMETFNEIYVLDLHGNSNKKEINPEGGKDENVFGIKTGTSIIFGVKRDGDVPAKVFHSEVYGKQEDKFKFLNKNVFSSIGWKELSPKIPNLYWIPFNDELKDEYDEGFSISEMFPVNGVGITTAHDDFVIKDVKKELLETYKDFQSSERDEDLLHEKFNVKKKKGWNILDGYDNIQNEEYLEKYIKPISYRPFDNRYIFYEDKLVWRTVRKIMDHYVNENIGLMVCRQQKTLGFRHILVHRGAVESSFISNKTSEIGSSFPLYLYLESGEKTPNLNQEIWNKINKAVGETKPENILDYIYAVLHSLEYREKYQEFLKIDFPRVPYPEDKNRFWKLVDIGKELRELHLMESPKVNEFITTFPNPGSNVIEKGYPKYEDRRVYINKQQYFDGVPQEVWEYYIGGYQPVQKWLKDRKERELNTEDIEWYQKIIASLNLSLGLMNKMSE